MRIYTFRIADPAVRQAQLELSSFLFRWFARNSLRLSGLAQRC